jgi:hypothetical protein
METWRQCTAFVRSVDNVRQSAAVCSERAWQFNSWFWSFARHLLQIEVGVFGTADTAYSIAVLFMCVLCAPLLFSNVK